MYCSIRAGKSTVKNPGNLIIGAGMAAKLNDKRMLIRAVRDYVNQFIFLVLAITGNTPFNI
jgi:hypothetical protein